jgi:propanol-preferring alcohol dehydrogenase
MSVQTTYWGTRPELVEVLDLAARGLVRATIITFPLAQAGDAYRRLEKNEVIGRTVVVPSSS